MAAGGTRLGGQRPGSAAGVAGVVGRPTVDHRATGAGAGRRQSFLADVGPPPEAPLCSVLLDHLAAGMGYFRWIPSSALDFRGFRLAGGQVQAAKLDEGGERGSRDETHSAPESSGTVRC